VCRAVESEQRRAGKRAVSDATDDHRLRLPTVTVDCRPPTDYRLRLPTVDCRLPTIDSLPLPAISSVAYVLDARPVRRGGGGARVRCVRGARTELARRRARTPARREILSVEAVRAGASRTGPPLHRA